MTANPILLRPPGPSCNLKRLEQLAGYRENTRTLQRPSSTDKRVGRNRYLVFARAWDGRWELRRTRSIWWSQAPSLQKRLAYIPLSPAVSQHLSARRLELSAHADNGRKKKPDGVEGNWPHVSELQDRSSRIRHIAHFRWWQRNHASNAFCYGSKEM